MGKQTENNNWILKSIAGVAVVLGVLLSSRGTTTLVEYDLSSDVPKWTQVIDRVSTVDFSQVTGLSEDLPLLMKNSPINSWKALSKWNPEYISKKFPTLRKVRKSTKNQTLFIYEDNSQPLRTWDNEHKKVLSEPNYEIVNMTSEEFFTTKDAVTFSHHFGGSVYETFAEDVGDMSFMRVVDTDEPEKVKSESNIWMARAGATTGLHYDYSHNMFAQISGCKRFLVYKPSQIASSKMHPLLHPRNRQSQLDGHKTLENDNLEAYVADLYPGDVLYLPPYFMHRVSAFKCGGDEFSISINTWSDSIGGGIVSTLNTFANIPTFLEDLAKTKSHSQRVTALTSYVTKLIGKVGSDSVRDFVRTKIVKERYMRQSKLSKALGCKNWKVSMCPQSAARFDTLLPYEAEADPSYDLPGDIEKHVNAAVEILKTGEIYGQDVIDIMLADHIERVVNFVVSIPHACSYLRCLATSFADKSEKLN